MIHTPYKTVASKIGINVNDENILSSENFLRDIMIIFYKVLCNII